MARERLEIGQVGKITCTQLPDGRWRARARVRREDGRVRSVEALGVSRPKVTTALRKRAERRAGNTSVGLTQDSTVSALIAEWWPTVEARIEDGSLRPQTVAEYRRYVDRIDAGIGSLTLREATTGRLDRWVKREAGKHATTMNSLRRHLRAMFTFAVQRDALVSNPAQYVSAARTAKATPRAATIDELQAFRARIAEYERAGTPEGRRAAGKAPGGRPRDVYLLGVVDLHLATGARIGEVLAIRWKDVDLGADRPTVEITGTITRLPGRREDGGGLVRQEYTKTDAGMRRVFLPAFAVETLLRLRVNDSGPGLDLVFHTSKGTPRDGHNVRTHLRKARGKEFEWITPHTFRKTVATLLEREEGVRASSLQLGHAETAVTERHYVERVHEAPDMSAVIESLGAPRSGPAVENVG